MGMARLYPVVHGSCMIAGQRLEPAGRS
jgi:hypothetical protein